MLAWIQQGLINPIPVGREIRIQESELIRFGEAQVEAFQREAERKEAVLEDIRVRKTDAVKRCFWAFERGG